MEFQIMLLENGVMLKDYLEKRQKLINILMKNGQLFKLPIIISFVSQMVKTSGFHPEDGGFDSPTNDVGVTPLRLKQKALNMGGVAQLVERENVPPQ